MNQYEKYKKAEKGAWISIIAYLILATIKITIAEIGNSAALRADGLNNTTDVIASVTVLIGLKISRKPPDKDHHYGHFRAETIASLVAALIMVFIGLQVIVETFRSIISGEYHQPDMLTAWTAVAAAVVMFVIYRYNLRLSKKVNSSALHAAAQDNKSDAYVSIGAAIGIFGAQLHWYWLDPLAGFIVGLIICKTAWHIFWDATHTLTDGFDADELETIRESIGAHPEVESVKDVKGRLHANQPLIEATIYVDPTLTVQESHDISDEIEETLQADLHVPHAHIHIEPFNQSIKKEQE